MTEASPKASSSKNIQLTQQGLNARLQHLSLPLLIHLQVALGACVQHGQMEVHDGSVVDV